MSVKSLLDNVEGISFSLPHRILQEIKSILIAVNPTQEDILIWDFSKDGWFSLKLAYLIAKRFNILNLDTRPHQWVWKASTSPRIQFFLWLCTHRTVPTKEVLGSRGLNLNLTYELCRRGSESILHTLKDCRVARTMWRDLGIEESNQEFFGLTLEDWLEKKIVELPICSQDSVFHGKSCFLKQSGLSGFIETRQSSKLGEWKRAQVLDV
ncbi:hypothetical protein SO802_018479 [Lithocarpus litseifolius]|uniref:Reverse transcriptase zinc-binding domain-containing protein n=1 Tax=Lithocarpus litseifolius TaxID=425828 RepID=A0AAW2CMH6_9ROSI